MLSSEFQQELAALIRSLQARIAEESAVQVAWHQLDPEEETKMDLLGVKGHIDRAIIRLVALRLSL